MVRVIGMFVASPLGIETVLLYEFVYGFLRFVASPLGIETISTDKNYNSCNSFVASPLGIETKLSTRTQWNISSSL